MFCFGVEVSVGLDVLVFVKRFEFSVLSFLGLVKFVMLSWLRNFGLIWFVK